MSPQSSRPSPSPVDVQPLIRRAHDRGLTLTAAPAASAGEIENDRAQPAQDAAAVWVAATEAGEAELAHDAVAALRELLHGPADMRRHVSDHVLLVPGAEQLPWQDMIPEAQGLALLYNFSPFQDTGSTVASKRLRQFGASVDVIACSFLHHKKADPTIERISAPYVKSKLFLPFAPNWGHWTAHAAFATRAADLAERYMAARQDPYEFLYTRAMWSPSLIAGALVKLRHPELHWVAEFSDPLSQDVEGKHRGGPVLEDACSSMLITALEERHGALTEQERTVFSLAELVAFAFADEIIFTNALQMKTMLDGLERQDLRERVRGVATVSHHPALPRPFYRMAHPAVEVSSEFLNIAYFGEFYSSRGLIEVTSAMRSLPEHLRERTRLHVFTNYVPAAEGGQRPRNFSPAQYDSLVRRALDGVGAHGIEHLVSFHPSLPFLEFLAATDAFDLLVVRDAATSGHHAVNPYLPSKWSDYSGSSAATWAIVEEGSSMWVMGPALQSPLDDVGAAREVLWTAVEDKFGSMEAHA